MVKFKYKEVGSFDFVNLIAKISTTPTSNKNACHIHQIVKRLNAARDNMIAEYDKELTQVFAKKDDNGKIIRPEDDPQGFTPVEGREDEFVRAQDAFGERTFTIDYRPLTPSVLADVKLSAKEIGLLGSMFVEQDGPGVPDLVGMPGMGREVRRAEARP